MLKINKKGIFMKTITSVISSRNKRSQRLHCAQDAEINLQENSTVAYPQSEGLSSKDEDFRQTMDTSLLPVHCNNLDDMSAAVKAGAKLIEIPDEVWRKVVEDFATRGHLDNPGNLGRNGKELLLEFSIGCKGCEDDT